MNAPELPSLTPAQVAALLRASPDVVSWRGAVSWLGAGSDHRAYALGEDRVVRLPRWPGGGEALRREARLLAWLTPRLPGAALPEVLHMGEPAPLAPEGFSVARRVPGVSALGPPLADPGALGEVLGCWLAELHALNPQGSGLGVDLDPTGRDWRDAALDDLAVAAAAGVLPEAGTWAARAQAVPDLWEVSPVPIHGDFAAEHVQLDGGGRPVGVLDWADAALGDPARDLAGLIHWGDPALWRAARVVYPASGVVWERAAWYALCRALGDLAFAAGEGRPAYLEAGRRALNGVRGWWTNAPPQS
ncbi:phosphotransferase [Deinococcus soli (ex Cha et al. 2016)]|uniref:Aminoglycoside phosphotransferase (APT) family kinase protein n=2 Tax=Deinococcus soli (ex Cha et al. 2016) TaxID=1309411 RepID=A0ACC6KC73_9DEIO|nr:phosphotransferase [Deinococcus soli (ex Cha et al. 2016)]MDR6216943.1 aminoglycoside phosphotransferase (APT) family kinase protein [Deinococcus soli (ex Cha et al. 2016)]MDR6327764.1 aminoglycoside phosphotransferase (APT) family kinase protein [Deinococcus soli (ex Cha et al. 2016)]MDR6750039.1 aminoglycoside phosphotransferase (APT) family kinase protein [Deinococcus soli (ex Cha et al. 2016)]